MRRLFGSGLLLLAACAAERPWTPLFDGASLDGWEATPFGGEGEVALAEGRARLGFGSPLTGLHRTEPLPAGPYELEVVAARAGDPVLVIPDRDPVPPPELPRDAPVLHVL